MKKIIMLISTAFLALMAHNEGVMGQAGNYNQVIEKLSINLAEGLIKKGKKAITIADFDNKDGSISELGQDIANDIEIALLSPKYNFTIVTRKELDRILEEQKISRNELTSSENVIKLGQIKNVQVLVIGTLTDWNEEIRVIVQVIDIEEGVKIVGVVDNITKFGTIQTKFSKIVSPGKNLRNPNHEEYNRLLGEANKLFLQENYSEALNRYEQAKSLLPENSVAEDGIKACKQKIAEKAAREKEALEERSWANAKAHNTIKAYKEYQYSYPSGKYVDDANAEIQKLKDKERKDQDETAWQQAQEINSIEAYKNYQKNFPNGVYYFDAYSQINKIRTEDSNEWERAKRANTINSYQAYLDKYPDGTYVGLAKSEIDELKKAQPDITLSTLISWLTPISNLKANSNKSYSLQSNLQNGSMVYSDRDYVWKDLPEYFKGAYSIITANEDKFINSDNFIEFTANQNIRVYIAYDPSYPQKPGWIYSFQKAADNLYFADTKNGWVSGAMLIHERTYNKGDTVRLGGNYNPAANHNGAMYAVFIKPL